MKKAICSIYVVIWMLYCVHWFCPGHVPLLDRFSSVLLAISFMMSLFVIIKGYNKYGISNVLCDGFFPLILMFLIYGSLYLAFEDSLYVMGKEVRKGSYLIGVLRTFVPVYTFYYMVKLGMMNTAMMRKFFFIIYVFLIWLNSRMVFFRGTTEFTNNMGYDFVYFIPFVLLFRNRPVGMFVLLSSILWFVMSCNKRGAVLIAVVLTIYILTRVISLRNKKGRVAFILAVIFTIGAVLYVSSYIADNEFFRGKIEMTVEGDDSGRTIIQRHLLDVMLNRSTIGRLLFGYGADGTLRIGTNYAHNDLVEIFVNNGFFGALIFLYFWIRVFGSWIKMRNDKIAFSLYGSIIIACFMSSLFSMFYSAIPFYLSMIWGYSVALHEDDICKYQES